MRWHPSDEDVATTSSCAALSLASHGDILNAEEVSAAGAAAEVAAARALGLNVGLQHYPELEDWLDENAEAASAAAEQNNNRGSSGGGGGRIAAARGKERGGGGVEGRIGRGSDRGGEGSDWGGGQERGVGRSTGRGGGGGGRDRARDRDGDNGDDRGVGSKSTPTKSRAVIPEDEKYLGSGLKPRTTGGAEHVDSS